MTQYLSEFEKYLHEEKKVASNTLESYMRDIRQYTEYLDAANLDVTRTDTANVEAFVSNLKECGKSLSTITRMLASIRAYYQFLMSCGVMAVNPAKSVKLEKNVRKTPDILTEKEISLLLSAPNETEFKGLRDKCMLELLYATGLRVSELVSLDIDDFRPGKNNRGDIVCHGSKGVRIIPMHEKAVVALRNYIENVRPLLISSDTGNALFINLNGSRLTRQGFWKIIKCYAEATKIKKDITPHTLRHSFALHLYEHGASLQDLQRMLGHVDISSTQIYANVSNHNTCEEVYIRCHPRAAAGRSYSHDD